MNSNTKKRFDTKKLTVTAMICALSIVAMFLFRFNVGFLTFDFKDAIMCLASLIYGPLTGIICVIATTVVESITVGDTGPYGLIMDFISSSTFILACGLVYKYKRNFNGAIFAAVCAVIAVPTVMMAANIIITPLYMNATRAEVIAMIPTVLLPFNICKALMNSALVLMIYKPMSNILKKTGLLKTSDNTKFKFGKKSVILLVVSAAVLVATALFIVFNLDGNFTLFGK